MHCIIEDYKANNIIVNIGNKNKYKFIDLGSLKKISDYNDISVCGPQLGSKMFLHWQPELLLGKFSSCSKKIDYFALGVLCYRLIFRKYPYSNSTKSENEVYEIYYREYDKAKNDFLLYKNEDNKLIIEFIIKCMHPDPTQRPDNMNFLE